MLKGVSLWTQNSKLLKIPNSNYQQIIQVQLRKFLPKAD